MSLASIVEEVTRRLELIPGLRVFDHAPDSINELPASFLSKIEGDFMQTMGETGVLWTLQVTLLVHQWDSPDAAAEVGEYVSPSGAKSVRAALDGAFAAAGGYVRVLRAKDVGRRQLFGGAYAAADFVVEARESGT